MGLKHQIVGGLVLAPIVYLVLDGNGEGKTMPAPEIEAAPETVAVVEKASFSERTSDFISGLLSRIPERQRETPPAIEEAFTAPIAPEEPTPEPALETEPAQPAAAPVTNNVTESPLPQRVRINPDGSQVYRVNGRNDTLTRATLDAFEEIERTKHIPVEMQIAACARESYCNPRAVNGQTEACGLFQLMSTPRTQTLYRLLFNHGAEYGYGEQVALVTRYNTADEGELPVYHFKPKNDAARATIHSLCLNPHFNASMHASETLWQIEEYEKWLGNREITIGEAVLMPNLGLGGLKSFAQQAWDDRKSGTNTMARAFFGPVISAQNPSLVKYANTTEYYTGTDGKQRERIVIGAEKTVRESYNDIINGYGGWQSRTDVLEASLR